MTNSNCPFCIEFEDIEESEFRGIFPREVLLDRFIKSTSNFVSLAALGAIRAGYLLILPKTHYKSFSFLSSEHANEEHILKNFLVDVVEKLYSIPIVFEHGSMDDESLAGGCIDHAHLHILPTNSDLFPRLSKEFQYKPIGHLAELSTLRLQEQPYIYYERANQGYAFLVNHDLPSQFMRRLLLEEEGNPDEWDWEVFLGKEKIVETVHKLKAGIYEQEASKSKT
jgi:diadenosine tetraphosphate (Ap4A) HIT family hydrolase